MTDEIGRPQRWVVVGVGAAVVAIDAGTKQLAVSRWSNEPASLLGGLVRFTESRNSGAAFGLGSSLTPFLTLLAGAVAVAIVVFAGRSRSRGNAILMGLFLGGASGNLVDRLFQPPGFMRGRVVDWIDIGWWPNFNLADSSLVLAAVLLVLASIKEPAPRNPTE